MTGESRPRGRCSRLIGRNRRRYGGYLVHAGIAVLFLGVAASSAFTHQRDVRLSAGQSTEGRTATRSPTASATARLGSDRAGHRRADLARRGARRPQGRQALRAAARRATTTRPRTPRRGRSRRFFEGEATSEVDVRWGLRPRRSGLAIQPDLSCSTSRSPVADRKFADAPGHVQACRDRRLAESYRQQPAAGALPGDRLAARRLDLDRRCARRLRRADGRCGPRRRRGCGASRASTRPASVASSRAPRRAPGLELRSPSSCWR